MKKIKIAEGQMTMAAMQIQKALGLSPLETEIAMTAALAEVRSFALHDMCEEKNEGTESEP